MTDNQMTRNKPAKSQKIARTDQQQRIEINAKNILSTRLIQQIIYAFQLYSCWIKLWTWKIKDLYLEYIQGDISHINKAFWNNLCPVKSGVEVYTGEKMRVESLHAKLRDNYDRWAYLISKGDPSFGILCVPEYVTEIIFLTTDMNGTRIYDNNKKNNQAL